MDGRRNFLKTAFATCSLLAGSKLLTACTPIKRAASEEEETFETFATPNALKGMPIKATFLDEILSLIHISEPTRSVGIFRTRIGVQKNGIRILKL